MGRNPFYESMREVAPGDVVYSFRDTLIAAIGIAQSNCYECPKPLEFGNAGMNWDKVGWKVDVGSPTCSTRCGRRITWMCCACICRRSIRRSRGVAMAASPFT
jgi:hypothetical protein